MPAEPTPTVLIVEDDEGLAELERARLEEAGYRAVVAATPGAALAALGRGPVGLVLLDYHLAGGVDGLEFYAGLKAAGRDLPVILVTGFSDEGTVIRALRAGVRDFVTKSVEYLDYLPEAVGRVLAQVRTERRLAESEARLAGVIGSAKDAVLVVEADRTVSLFNPAAERMFDCPAAAALGRPVTDFIPDDPADPAGPPRAGADGVRAGGGRFPVEASVSRGDAGGRRFSTMVVRDVTERKRLEAERDALLARLQLHIERMPLAYILFDADLRVADWNPAAERIFGYSRAEAVGMDAFALIPPAGRPAAEALFRRVRAGDMAAHSETANRTKDGRAITCEWLNTPLLGGDGSFTGVLCLVQDVTGRKVLEEQFRQAQKMEAVGRLAGGVAHDFNNLLTVINGYSDLLVQALPPGDPSREMAVQIHRAGEQSAGLTGQLLAFSRQQVLAPQVLDLNAVVADTEKMLGRVIGEDVRLTTVPAAGLWPVLADPGQLEQVLMNLAVNARDAMPQGGRLTIETRNAEVTGADAGAHPDARPGPHVRLAVSDTGHGMTAEVKAKVFEPFFTTKGVGKGTGLGLATVYGIVKQSGGHVRVASEVGRGTTFEVYLPRTATAEAPRGAARVPAAPAGTETVLLVEDESAVRALTRRVLTRCGYRVLEAAAGDEAVRVAAGHPGPIHLVVSDVVMPGGGGRGVAERVTALHPGVRVLFVSGYTDDAVLRHGVQHDQVNFLQKPYSPAVLAHRVREILDAPAGP